MYYEKSENSQHKVHTSKNSTNKEKDRSFKLNIHSNKVRKRDLFSSRMESSSPSKMWWFCSRQINHIRHNGTASQITANQRCPKFPLQQANNSTALLGITREMPNRHNTIVHGLCMWWWDKYMPFGKVKDICFQGKADRKNSVINKY